MFQQTNFSLLLLVIGVFFMNCNSQRDKVGNNIISQDYYEYSGISEKQTLIIKDQESWNKVHDEIFANQIPKPGYSIIDFSQFNIVVFAFGQKSTGGYYYTVQSYQQNGDILNFKITIPKKDPYTPVTMAITNPVVYCKIEATSATEVQYEIFNE